MRRRWPALAALGLLAYMGLPYVLVQVANLGLVREGKRSRREIALTFDDGPDPITTPAVLDALQRAGAKATFFVLPSQAEAHADLIQRQLAEGHQVEAHGQRHKHAWLRSPWGAFFDPVQAAGRVAAVTGQKVRLQRPPHGAYTLATVLGQKRAGVTGAHWGIESHDWDSKFTPQQIRERLSRLMVPGAVVVLHDAGPGAKKTVPMLPELLTDLKARGYSFRTLAQLDGAKPQDWAAIRRRIFIWLDGVFDQLQRVRFSGDQADNLWRIGHVRYPFGELVLNDGTKIQKGTPAAEFHINSPLMVDIGLRRVVRQGPVDFRLTVRDLLMRPDLQNAQVIYCVSSFASLVEPFGFETHDLTESDARRLQHWGNLLRRVYGTSSDAQRPRLSVMTRAKVTERYGLKDN